MLSFLCCVAINEFSVQFRLGYPKFCDGEFDDSLIVIFSFFFLIFGCDAYNFHRSKTASSFPCLFFPQPSGLVHYCSIDILCCVVCICVPRYFPYPFELHRCVTRMSLMHVLSVVVLLFLFWLALYRHCLCMSSSLLLIRLFVYVFIYSMSTYMSFIPISYLFLHYLFVCLFVC